ncbi:PKAR, partial [Symbiodinium pilosum]
DVKLEYTGKGYVTFAAHEQAVSLVDTLAEEDGTDSIMIKGSWSLSEKMLQKSQGPFKGDTITALAQRLRALQDSLKCDKLLLGGDGSPSTLAEITEVLGRKPFQQALYILARTSLPEEQVKQKLKSAVVFATSNPAMPKKAVRPAQQMPPNLQTPQMPKLSPVRPGPRPAAPKATYVPPPQGGKTPRPSVPSVRPVPVAASAARAPRAPGTPARGVSGGSAATPKVAALSPCILVRGIAASWTEQQVKLLFSVFGGVAALQMAQDANGRFARVQLKVPDKMTKAVEQFNNTQAGFGFCQLREPWSRGAVLSLLRGR